MALGEEYSWFDAGTADSLYAAAGEIREAQKVSGKMIGCLEEIALENGWISVEQVRDAAERMEKMGYGECLRKVIKGA